VSISRTGLREGLRRIWRRLRGGGFTPVRFGLSLSVGLFIGSLPVYGLHLPLCTLVCLPLRLDLPVAYLAAHVSNPLLAPFLLFAELDLGSLVLTGRHVPIDLQSVRATGVGEFAAQAAVGAIGLGATLGVLGGLGGYWLARALNSRHTRSSPSAASSVATSASSNRASE
jgi:uncharacterized protein (DUF2062 family)